MSKVQKQMLYVLLFLTSILLSACSSDSSNNSNSTDTTPPVKTTGQTVSYNESGAVVGDESLKDDGYYQAGVDPDFTRASDIVTDELTGLMWQDDTAVTTNQKQWLTTENYDLCDNNQSSPACYDTAGDTAVTYCASLSLGGYTNWRLPTIEELSNLSAYGQGTPFIDSTFVNVTSEYWSSTTGFIDDNYTARYIRYGHAYVGADDKNNVNYVRCVRD